jgi:uncharacterized protein with FMN-binding domain
MILKTEFISGGTQTMAKGTISRKDLIKGVVAGVVSIAAIGAMQAIENTASTAANAVVSSEASTGSGAYIPGSYTATATGMGEISMIATFDADGLIDLELDLANETPEIGQAAGDTLIEQCLAAQSSSIDGVSGATVTTDAVKECLDDCFAQAAE